MTSLHFAQISDIHISSLGNHHELLGAHAPDILAGIIADLNRRPDLDFVLITGDLFDEADQSEFDQFQAGITSLNRPYYIIPGNHDRRSLDRTEGLTRRDFARHFNPQINQRPTEPQAQAGYWSIAVDPQVQIIGLDSIRDEDWGGVIDDLQWRWLEQELKTHADKFVIVAVHHPLHKLAPVDDHPSFTNFVCSNGPQLLALLDDHPQVKLVLTGHHHQTKVDDLGHRLHAAAPSISIYPLAYRTFRLSRSAGQPWRLSWQTHDAAGPDLIDQSKTAMIDAWHNFAGFDLAIVEQHMVLALGTEADRQGRHIFKESDHPY
ncbi:MAG: metallophosphoesterase [Anaerolineae bacterium]|nr:metallophosphoesterase [Anaerolineae bacterium]